MVKKKDRNSKKSKDYEFVPEIVSTSELQRGAGRVVDMVQDSNKPLYIVRNNDPQAVIIGIDEYEAMKQRQKKLEIRSALIKVAQAEEELREGNIKKLTDKVMGKWLDEAKSKKG